VERDCLVVEGPQGIGATSDGRIEIEIAGARVHVPAGADVGTLQNVVAVLRAVR
jgi:hypothetical protein